jgi:hypothetical protein
MQFKTAVLFLFAGACLAQSTPQHDMSKMNMGDMDMSQKDMSGMDMGDMDMSKDPHQASGTSFNPASSPMAMIHKSLGGWHFSIHGAAFIGDIQQTGPRGGDKFTSVNWFMGEATHRLGGGTFAIRSMLSLEPATVTGERYPELFQTGETAYGKPIVDGQHPHNLFMEIAFEYSHPLGENTKVNFYFAPVGDPALGPVAFPHRVSASELPQATLAHHLEDSTHISYDVATVSVTHGIFGLEASGFHGAEPGENRWTISSGAIDSWATRLTVTPSANWTAQVSVGRLDHPEALEPGDIVRSTGSITYNRPLANGNWASSLIWGRNHETATQRNLNAFTAESVVNFDKKNYITGRFELVDKDELIEGAGPTYRIGAYTLGYTRDIPLFPMLTTGLGANFTMYNMPDALHTLYGERPVAAWVFLRVRLKQGH